MDHDRLVAGALLAAALAGCGGGAGETTVGGSVSGLPAGTAVTLQNNGRDTLAVAANGGFTFQEELPAGDSYSVAITVQPSGGTCTVTEGSGTIDNNASKITGVRVTCVANFPVGGSVTGLQTGASVSLLNNGTDPVVVSGNGSFQFPTRVPPGSSYNVTISTQTEGTNCNVTNQTGQVESAPITTVTVAC